MGSQLTEIGRNLASAARFYAEATAVNFVNKYAEKFINGPAGIIFACNSTSICDDLVKEDGTPFGLISMHAGSDKKTDLDQAWRELQEEGTMKLKNGHASIVEKPTFPGA